jgi:hypothetical protein
VRRLELLRSGQPRTESRSALTDYVTGLSQFVFGGSTYGVGFTWNSTSRTESVQPSIAAYAAALAACPPAFAAQLVRGELMAQVDLVWQGLRGSDNAGKIVDAPLGDLASVSRSGLLEQMEWHAGIGGTAFLYRDPSTRSLRALRPDWVTVIIGSDQAPEEAATAIDGEVVGYVYRPGGTGRPVVLLPENVASWAPIPDPLSPWRGMSWLTPVLREMQGDYLATEHKLKFFENAGTPNMVFSLDPTVTPEQLRDFKAATDDATAGVGNAYKNLYLGGGADVTVVGKDMAQLEFGATLAAGENRIAVASRVPAAILGVKEGLQGSTLNAGNFGQARRAMADTWLFANLRSLCASLETLVTPPAGLRLWYDPQIPFLREDARDAAEINRTNATAIRSLADGGFDPDSVVAAVTANDMSLLVHTGRLSVQLQKPNDNASNDSVDDTI